MISLSDTNTQAQKIDMLFRKTLTGLSSKWPLKIKDNMLLDCLDNLKERNIVISILFQVIMYLKLK